MRLISINEITGEEILAQPIIDINGRKLLSQGIRLQPSFIEKLSNKGIYSIYVEDEISEGIEMDSVLCSQTRIKAKMAVNEELDRLCRNSTIDSERIRSVVREIVDEILSRHNKMITLKDVRMQDEYTFAHSVNVCVLSTVLASKLGFPKDKIYNIGMGALLHDFGKVLVSPEILKKGLDLTPAEEEEMKKHPLYGYNFFKADSTIPATVKIAVLMHHEKIDGTGYPLGIEGDKIHYSARIIAICDTFDLITSDRKHKNALNTSDAVEFLLSSAGTALDKDFVNTFLKIVPVFPNGTIVLLSNGLIGIVVKNNPRYLTRPVVRMLYNPKTKTKYGKDYVIDLMDDLSLKIINEIKLDKN